VALSAAGLGWIAAGLAGAGAVAWLSRAGRWPWLPAVPAGDLLAPLERLGRAVWQRIDPGHAASDHADEPPEPVPPPMGDAAVPGLERALLRWPVFGLAVVLVMALIVILLASQSR
jgi:hypothetical protein